METECVVVHHSLDGKSFEVQRLACSYCGRQVRTARERSGAGDIEANF